MAEQSGTGAAGEDDRRIATIVAEQRSRLSAFIRQRVPDAADADDILQDVFFELVRASRLLMPVDHVTGWLFRVARNRITDLFRRKRPDTVADDLLPSPDAGPEAEYLRGVLLEELSLALDELSPEQRSVFVAHELEGRSFQQLALETGVNVNTLLSRKRYAVRRLRERLQRMRDEFIDE